MKNDNFFIRIVFEFGYCLIHISIRNCREYCLAIYLLSYLSFSFSSVMLSDSVWQLDWMLNWASVFDCELSRVLLRLSVIKSIDWVNEIDCLLTRVLPSSLTFSVFLLMFCWLSVEHVLWVRCSATFCSISWLVCCSTTSCSTSWPVWKFSGVNGYGNWCQRLDEMFATTSVNINVVRYNESMWWNSHYRLVVRCTFHNNNLDRLDELTRSDVDSVFPRHMHWILRNRYLYLNPFFFKIMTWRFYPNFSWTSFNTY